MLRTWTFGALMVVATASASHACVFLDIMSDPQASALWVGGDYYRVEMRNTEPTGVVSITLDFTPLPTALGANTAIQNEILAPTFAGFGDSFFVIPDGAAAITSGIVDGEDLGLAGTFSLQGGAEIVPSGQTRTVAYLGLKTGSADLFSELALQIGDVIGSVMTVESAAEGQAFDLGVFRFAISTNHPDCPEPASLALLAVGGLATLRRR